MNSIHIGRIFGSPLSVHWTFFGALAAILILSWDAPHGRGNEQILLLGMAVTALVLHELGHALTAKITGVKVQGIVLHIFGGVTQLEAASLKGWKEIPVAAGGPAVNLACALCVLAPNSVVASFGQMSLLFGSLNLIPAWPLDGGRVLRGLLSLRLPRPLASFGAVALGLLFCVGLFLYGLFSGQWIALLLAPYLAWIGLKAIQTEMEAGLFSVLKGLERDEEPEPFLQEDPRPQKPPPFADNLSQFHGSLADFLKEKKKQEDGPPHPPDDESC